MSMLLLDSYKSLHLMSLIGQLQHAHTKYNLI